MRLVIPIKMNKENSAIAPLFGKAKWFAFVEDGKVTIEKNPAQGGTAVIRWFIEQNVDAIVFQEMGTTPYEMIRSEGNMKLYHTGYDRILLDELLQKFDEGKLVELDESNMAEIIKNHESSHTHGDGQGLHRH